LAGVFFPFFGAVAGTAALAAARSASSAWFFFASAIRALTF
jgi:hypothetical protein